MAISAFGGFLLFVIGLIVLFILAEGVTIEMVREASLGNKADLSRSLGDLQRQDVAADILFPPGWNISRSGICSFYHSRNNLELRLLLCSPSGDD